MRAGIQETRDHLIAAVESHYDLWKKLRFVQDIGIRKDIDSLLIRLKAFDDMLTHQGFEEE